MNNASPEIKDELRANSAGLPDPRSLRSQPPTRWDCPRYHRLPPTRSTGTPLEQTDSEPEPRTGVTPSDTDEVPRVVTYPMISRSRLVTPPTSSLWNPEKLRVRIHKVDELSATRFARHLKEARGLREGRQELFSP